MHDEPLVWDRVEWRQGDGRYCFEVVRGGLHATLTAPGERSLTLPVVAWDGLLDALAAARKTRARTERSMPACAGARWGKAETDELVAAFKSGATVPRLAVAHNRTAAAIEAKLAELGLWDGIVQAPRQRASVSSAPPWPDGPPSSAVASRDYDPARGWVSSDTHSPPAGE